MENVKSPIRFMDSSQNVTNLPFAGSMLPYPDARLSPRTYEDAASYAYKTMCDEHKIQTKAVVDIEKERIHYKFIADMDERRWAYQMNRANALSGIYANSENQLCLETVLPTGQRYTSKALLAVPIKAIVLCCAETKRPIAVKFLLGSEDCFYLSDKMCTSKNFSAALRRHGVAMRVNHNRRKELSEAILTFLRAHAETVFLPPKYGWYYDGERWRFAGEAELTLEEVEKKYGT